MNQARLGILGGTFDPPHIGHLLLAEIAREDFSLEKVLFLPAGQPPHKQNRDISAAQHRQHMTELAIADNDTFSLDTIDLDRPPPHFTVTLLPQLQDKFPHHELWLLIGGDSLRDLLSWQQPEQVIRDCYLGVLPRPGANIDWPRLEATLPQLRERVVLLDGPAIALSSSHIRQRVKAGRSIRYLTPDSVRDFIHHNNLYRRDEG